MRNRIRIIISLVLLLTLSVSVSVVYAFLTSEETVPIPLEIGKVDVDYQIYFANGDDVPEVYINTFDGVDYYKTGIYQININNKNSADHIKNLRIDFKINSNVDTYLRIKTVMSTVMLINNPDGTKTEFAVDEDFPLYYSDNWAKSLDTMDDYVYYTNPVQKLANNTALTIPLLRSDTALEYENIDRPDYWLHVEIVVDAVQTYLGPKYNWGLLYKPWLEDEVEW